MSFITLKCKNCGSSMTLNTESHSATCTHCGSTFMLVDLLDEKDIEFTEKTTPKNIEQKLFAGDELKKGETCIFQANYEEAEQHFKKAIELDSTNYKAYLGVVKSKTQNLNIIPESDDFLYYANQALELSESDDRVYVKSELAKIELLKREKVRQVKQKQQSEIEKQQKKEFKRRVNKFFTKITIIVCILFLALIFLGTYLFK